jgi:hypothetical protein
VAQHAVSVWRREGSISLRVAAGSTTDEAEVIAVPVHPREVPWMQLLTMRRDPGFTTPSTVPLIGITQPTPIRGEGAAPELGALSDDAVARQLARRHRFQSSPDPMQITLVARARGMAANETQPVRVQQIQGNKVVGGFTTILLP